jgi:Predicted permeases
MNVMAAIDAMIVLGYLLRRFHCIDQSVSAGLSRICADVLMPVMILKSMIFEITADTLRECAVLIAGSSLILLLEYLCGRIFIRIAHIAPSEEQIYRYCILFTNFGLIGIPIAEGLYGEKGVFYFTIFILTQRILFNSYGVMLMRRSGDRAKGFQVRQLFNLPILAVIAGLSLSLLHIQLWGPVDELVSMLSKANAPMGLLTVGLNLADSRFSAAIRSGAMWSGIALRLVLLPLAGAGILRRLGIGAPLLEIGVLSVALPCPAMASVLAKRYGGNAALGSQMVLLSTVCSSVTIPLVLAVCRLL